MRIKLKDANNTLSSTVLGQSEAVYKAVDVLTRYVVGLTAAHGSPSSTKPRGVLFFAGPTGVGKTELAKAITKLLFLDETAVIRFDMSEFSAEHSADRLIGAPPGYVGYDAGGELTNAIRQRPFSLVLFDEIEKAHPRILDKFLQILDDGRLTDGRGDTVYFTEAILVFTSNLGIYADTTDEFGNVVGRELNVIPEMERDELVNRVSGEIRDYFTRQLNRPELLNRLGDNIVIFNFISEVVAAQIVDLKVANVASAVQSEHGVSLTLEPAAHTTLTEVCLADLSLGGRGIGSIIETTLIDPLARYILADPLGEAADITVTDIVKDGPQWKVIAKSD